MLKTTTITELRTSLSSSYLNKLEEGPVIIMSHSRPAAVLVDHSAFDALLDKCELLEDIIDGRRIIGEYLDNKETVVDAEEVFARLGH